jgi:hypothetical protein
LQDNNLKEIENGLMRPDLPSETYGQYQLQIQEIAKEINGMAYVLERYGR